MRLELEEVEAVLAAHPAVRHAAVAVRRNAAGASQLVGYVIAAHRPDADCARLVRRAAARVHGARRRRAPGRAPGHRQRQGRPGRAARARPARRRRPARPRTADGAGRCATSSPPCSACPVGADDDFFALGGDSIVAIGVVREARRAGIAMRPRDLLTHRTPAGVGRGSPRPPPRRVSEVDRAG